MSAARKFIKNIMTKWRNDSIIFLFAAIYAITAILHNELSRRFLPVWPMALLLFGQICAMIRKGRRMRLL